MSLLETAGAQEREDAAEKRRRDLAVGMCNGCGNERNACACDSGGVLEIPPFVKGEMRKHMAFLRLIDAAKALLDENTEVARISYAAPGEKLTDAEWRREDEENFKVCREVRNALKEAKRSLAPQSSGGADGG
jgi:hypothetical protein